MRVLVTGSEGFTGNRMMQFLSQQEGVAAIGLVRNAPTLPQENSPRISYVVADLLNHDYLFKTVVGVCPDAIIHIGGLTHGTLEAMLQANVVGTKNILDAGHTANPDCRILVISSSAVYGYPGTAPISESTPLHPLSEYGISKMAQDALALMYHELNDACVSVARPFNLAGPGQPESFICGRIIKQATEIEQQKKPGLELLEITSSRDLIDVRDVVRGYWALINHPDFSEDCAGKAFNIGSGNAYLISEIITLTEEITGRHFEVKLPQQLPKVTLPTQQSDNTQITNLTGWRPEISLKETLRDMLAASRGKG
jgi:nucleoside-diphosphate-sugar epimerase